MPDGARFTIDHPEVDVIAGVLVSRAATAICARITGRCAALRRIHWAADGRLLLDRRPDEEVAPHLRRVSGVVRVRPDGGR